MNTIANSKRRPQMSKTNELWLIDVFEITANESTRKIRIDNAFKQLFEYQMVEGRILKW